MHAGVVPAAKPQRNPVPYQLLDQIVDDAIAGTLTVEQAAQAFVALNRYSAQYAEPTGASQRGLAVEYTNGQITGGVGAEPYRIYYDTFQAIQTAAREVVAATPRPAVQPNFTIANGCE